MKKRDKIKKGLFIKRGMRVCILFFALFLPMIQGQAQTLSGSGTVGSPYLIQSATDLSTWRTNASYTGTNSQGKYFKLTVDIELTTTYTAIGTSASPFMGIFDGNNKSITGLKMNTTATTSAGLFGYTSGATIKNLAVQVALGDSLKATASGVGILTGQTIGGTFTNCCVIGTVIGNGNVGGLIGLVASGTPVITGCYSMGIVKVLTTTGYAGGIVGNAAGSTISGCYTTATISGYGNYYGGIAGNATGSVQNCVAANQSVATAQSSPTVGRIVGLGSPALNANYALNTMLLEGVTTTGTATNKNGLDKSYSDLLKQATYTSLGWTFNSSGWSIWEGVNYPFFGWQSAPVKYTNSCGTTVSGTFRSGVTMSKVALYKVASSLGNAMLGSNTWTLTHASLSPGSIATAVAYETGKTASYPVYSPALTSGQLASANYNIPGDFATLKEAADKYNNCGISGNVNFIIAGDLVLTETVEFWGTAPGSQAYTLTIRSDGSRRRISGNINGALIRLKGANNITIDGLTAVNKTNPDNGNNKLVFSNTYAVESAYVGTIEILKDENDNNGKNIFVKNIELSNVVYNTIGISNLLVAIDNITVTGCYLHGANENVMVQNLQNFTFTDNVVRDARNTGMSLAAYYPTNYTIKGNDIGNISGSGTTQMVLQGIILSSAGGGIFTIEDNTIHDIQNTATGDAGAYGIVAGVDGTLNINRNVISNISNNTANLSHNAVGIQATLYEFGGAGGVANLNNNTVTGITDLNNPKGIEISSLSSSAIATLDGNTVSAITAGTAEGNNAMGIRMNMSGSISNNKVYGLSAPTGRAVAIYGANSNPGTCTFINNMIYGIKGRIADGFSMEGDNASYKVYYNSVRFTERDAANLSTRCLVLGVAGSSQKTIADVQDNLFSNELNAGGNTFFNCGSSGGAGAEFSIIRNNRYYMYFGFMGEYKGVFYQEYATWSPATGDVGSISFPYYEPLFFGNNCFVSATDLHLTPTAKSDRRLGTPLISPYNTDFDGNARTTCINAAGADNYTVQNIYLANMNAPAVCVGAKTNIWLDVVNGVSPYQYKIDNGTYVSITDNNNTIAITSPAVLSAGQHTLYILDANGCEATGTFTVAFNALPAATISGASAVCGTGSQATYSLNTSSSLQTYLWSVTGTGNVINNAALSTPAITWNNSGTLQVTFTDVNGCSNTASLPVAVEPQHTVRISMPDNRNADSICHNDPFTLTAVTTGNVDWIGWFDARNPDSAIPAYTNNNPIIYDPNMSDIGNTVKLFVKVHNPVCNYVTDTVSLQILPISTGIDFELTGQPLAPQEICADTTYMFKVKATDKGNVKNLSLVFDDYRATQMKMQKAEIQYSPVDPDNEAGWEPLAFYTHDDYRAVWNLPQPLAADDSVLLRVTVAATCNFSSGTNVRFILNSTTACDDPLPSDTVHTADFYLVQDESVMNSYEVTGDFVIGSLITGKLTNNTGDTVAWNLRIAMQEYKIPTNSDHESVIISIPAGLIPLEEDAYIPGLNAPDTLMEVIENDSGTVYEVALPSGLGENDIVEMIFKFQALTSPCGIYEPSCEVAFTVDSVICGQDTCSFNAIRGSFQPGFEVERYVFSFTDTAVVGTITNGLWSGVTTMKVETEVYAGDTIYIDYYVDRNNNSMLDAADTLIHTRSLITIPVSAGQPYTDTASGIYYEPGYQLLQVIRGAAVCESKVIPVITVAGVDTLCQSDTTLYYVSAGMSNYRWNVVNVDAVSGATPKRIPLENSTPANYVNENTVRAVWPKAGNYKVWAQYTQGTAPNERELGKTYFTVYVYQRPVVVLTAEADTTVCAGSTVELSHFFSDTTGIGTLSYYKKETDGSYTLLPAQEVPLYVTPFNTTTYMASAVSEVSGCESSRKVELTVNVNPVPAAPVITTDPADGVICGTGLVTLTAVGSYDAPTYSWYKDGAAVTGEESNSLTIGKDQAGNYTVTVDVRACTSAESAGAGVIDATPAVTIVSVDKMCSAQTAAFTVDFTGTPPFAIEYTLTDYNSLDFTESVGGITGNSYTIETEGYVYNNDAPVTIRINKIRDYVCDTWIDITDISKTIPADSIYRVPNTFITTNPLYYNDQGTKVYGICYQGNVSDTLLLEGFADGFPVTWQIETTADITIDPVTGLITAHEAGTATIICTGRNTTNDLSEACYSVETALFNAVSNQPQQPDISVENSTAAGCDGSSYGGEKGAIVIDLANPVPDTNPENVVTYRWEYKEQDGNDWYVIGGNDIWASGQDNAVFQTNDLFSKGSYTLRVTAVSAYGCEMISEEVLFTIVESKSPQVQQDNTSPCVNEWVEYSGVNVNYWTIDANDPGDYVVAEGYTLNSNPVKLKWVSTGNRTLTAYCTNDAPCSTTTEDLSISVQGTPVTISADGDIRQDTEDPGKYSATVCAGSAGTFTADVTGGTWTIDDDTVAGLTDNGDGTATVSGKKPGGTAVVRYVYTGQNCMNTTIVELEVTGATVELTGCKDTLIAGSTNSLGVLLDAPAGGVYTWSVVPGNGNVVISSQTETTCSFTTLNCNISGIYMLYYRYETSDGCSAIDSCEVEVFAPVAVVVGDADPCQRSSVTYTAADDSDGNGYTWTISGVRAFDYRIIGAGDENSITVQWLTSGNETISLSYTNANGCLLTSDYYGVTVKASPSFSLEDTTTCVSFDLSDYTAAYSDIDFIYYDEAGVVMSDLVVDETGIFYIQGTGENGCSYTDTVEVQILGPATFETGSNRIYPTNQGNHIEISTTPATTSYLFYIKENGDYTQVPYVTGYTPDSADPATRYNVLTLPFVDEQATGNKQTEEIFLGLPGCRVDSGNVDVWKKPVTIAGGDHVSLEALAYTATGITEIYLTNDDNELVSRMLPEGNHFGIVSAEVETLQESAAYYTSGSDGKDYEYLARRFRVNPGKQPSDSISVYLYFTETELENFIARSEGNTNQWDDLHSLASIRCTKYTDSGNTFTEPNTSGKAVAVIEADTYDATYDYVGLRVDGFSTFYLHGGGTMTPLPVNLIRFNAECHGNKVLITWQTGTEINNDYFTVEKSFDGYSFIPVGKISGAGNSDVAVSYSWRDEYNSGNITYYRLKQTDFNGRYEYFAPVSVLCTPLEQANDYIIYPNPVESVLYIKFPGDSIPEGDMELYNNLGMIVYRSAITGSLDVSFLSQGIYFIKMNVGNMILPVKKFEKKN